MNDELEEMPNQAEAKRHMQELELIDDVEELLESL